MRDCNSISFNTTQSEIMSFPLAERLDAIEDLPTIPHTMQMVLSEIESISSSAESLQVIIGQDPVLTAKIIKMANSVFYSPLQEISSVGRAIVNMGFNDVRDVVIGLSLAGLFCDDLGFDEFNSTDLWIHSIGVGITAKKIASKVNGLDPDDMFTAGMLHDLGRLVYCLYFKDELHEVLAATASSDISLDKAEDDYGLTHADIGAYLANRWTLGEMLINVIKYHHKPQEAGDYVQAASVVFLADALAKKLGFGWTGIGESNKIIVPHALGLDGDTVREIARQMTDEKEKIVEGWGKVISD